MFQIAGSSTTEVMLHMKWFIDKSTTLTSQERLWEVIALVLNLVIDEVINHKVNTQLGFCLHILLGILLDIKLVHLRCVVLAKLRDVVMTVFETKILENIKDEVAPYLNRIVLTLLQMHAEGQNLLMSHSIRAWREEQASMRCSIGLLGGVADDGDNDVWGWGGVGASALEANSNYDTDIQFALSSHGKHASEEAEKMMTNSYDLLEVILLKSPLISNALQKIEVLPTETASKPQLRALSDLNIKFGNVPWPDSLLQDEILESTISKFLSLAKRFPGSHSSPQSGDCASLSIESRSLLVGINRLERVLKRLSWNTVTRSIEQTLSGCVGQLFALSKSEIPDDIKIAASRCLGELNGFEPLSGSDHKYTRFCRMDPLVKARETAMELLAKFIQSNNSETAIIAKDTARALLGTGEGSDHLESVRKDVQRMLCPLVSDRPIKRNEIPSLSDSKMTYLVSKLDDKSTNTRNDRNWCWCPEIWKCDVTGDVSFEQWAKDVVCSMIICCYSFSDEKGQDAEVEGEGTFFPICIKMCAQEHEFAEAMFPAIVYDLLASGVGLKGNSKKLDDVRAEIAIGSPFSVANSTLTRCFSSLINSSCHKGALGLVIDTLDLLRCVTMDRFLLSKIHQSNKPQRSSLSKSRSRRDSNAGLGHSPKWKGVPFGVVLHLSGMHIALACIRSKRFASGLFYADLYADNWLGGSGAVLERLSSDDGAEMVKCDDWIPKLDISGSGTSTNPDDSILSEEFVDDDVLSCAHAYQKVIQQCFLELHEMDAIQGGEAQEVAINFGQEGQRFLPISEMKRSSRGNDWQYLADLDAQLHLPATKATQALTAKKYSSGCAKLTNCLENLGMRHILRNYNAGLINSHCIASSSEKDMLKETFFQDAWRTLQWDNSLLGYHRTSTETLIAATHTQLQNQSMSASQALSTDVCLLAQLAQFHLLIFTNP